MPDIQAAIKTQLSRQVIHWTKAARRLADLDDLASHAAWHSLERYIGLSIRQHLTKVVAQLIREGDLLQAALASAVSPVDLLKVRRQLLNFRNRYTRVEMTLVFFADAINTRTNPKISGYLKACDVLAYRSMAMLLDQLGKPTPSALSYFEKGIGAAVLRANLRLWDGTGVNPVAAIKITHHNLLPTALIHEAGHQVAAVVGWNEELASKLATGLTGARRTQEWASWASRLVRRLPLSTRVRERRRTTDVPAVKIRWSYGTTRHPHPISRIRPARGGVPPVLRQVPGTTWRRHGRNCIPCKSEEHPACCRPSPFPRIVEITSADEGFWRPLAALINRNVSSRKSFAMEQQLGPAFIPRCTGFDRSAAVASASVCGAPPPGKRWTFAQPEECH
jgi:hypothetical protein